MTRIDKNKQNNRTRINNKTRKNRINQIIRDGINRAADHDDQYMLRMLNVMGDYRGNSAAFYRSTI